MSNIMIRDLAQSRELDCKAMSAVRGGFAGTNVINNLNLGIGVSNTLIMPISVLNGSWVGAPVSADFKIAPKIISQIGL
jgi:hypothetical protein